MQKFLGTIPGIIIGMVVCVGLILLAIYPHRPKDILGWVALILISGPVVLSLEYIGAGLFENRFTVRMSRLTKIVFGVIALLIASVPIVLIWNWLMPHLGTW